MAAWGAFAGGVAAGLESGQRMRSQRERDQREREESERRKKDWEDKQEDRETNKRTWEKAADIIRRATEATQQSGGAVVGPQAQAQAPTQAAPQAAVATPIQDAGVGIEPRELPPGGELPPSKYQTPPFIPADQAARIARSARVEQGSPSVERRDLPAREPGTAALPRRQTEQATTESEPLKHAGFSIFKNPNALFDNPQAMNELGALFMRSGNPVGVKWLEAGYKAYKEGEFQALALAAKGDYAGAEELFNRNGQNKVVPGSTRPVEGKPGWVSVTGADGRTVEFDPGARIAALTNPQKFMEEQNRVRDDARAQERQSADLEIRRGILDVHRKRADTEERYRQQMGNAAQTRAAQPRSSAASRESIDNAHKSVDEQIKRLSIETGPNNRPVLDDAGKPVISPTKMNQYYDAKTTLELAIEEALGHELGPREIRILGQHLGSAPLGNAQALRAWGEKVGALILNRPSAQGSGRGAQGRPTSPGAPPVPGARLGRDPTTGRQAWFRQTADGGWEEVAAANAGSSSKGSTPNAKPQTSSPSAQRASPAQMPAATPVQSANPVDNAGQQLDAARQSVAQARAVLQGFGFRQQRDNPEGFAQARAALDAAMRAAQDAELVYRQAVGNVPSAQTQAVTGRPGYASGGLVSRSPRTSAHTSSSIGLERQR